MAFQFPWTNMHELNLDWFLSKFKQFTDNYLGTTATAESVPYTDAPSVTVTGSRRLSQHGVLGVLHLTQHTLSLFSSFSSFCIVKYMQI